MDLALSDAQCVLRADVSDFAQNSLRQTAQARSDEGRWDQQILLDMGQRRWPGVLIPAEYGGMGAGALEHALIVEELSRVDASIGATQNLLQQTAIATMEFAPEHLQQKYLPLFAAGESFAITGLTETTAGSKLSDMKTTARREGENWVVNGVKTEVHIPQFVELCLVFAQTENGISSFLVETSTPGFNVLEERPTVGLRALPMYAVEFADCVVPENHLLVGDGAGLEVFFKSFDLTRIGNAAKCVGIGEGALDDALAYAERRSIGPNVVTDFQGIRWQIADLRTRLHAARLLTYEAACVYDATGKATRQSNMAKLMASVAAMDATTFALQMTGSHGCFTAQPFARYMMDAKVSQLTGGSVEILRNTVARELLGKPTAMTR